MINHAVFTEDELADRCAIDSATLSSWVGSGLIQPAARASNGKLLFAGESVERIDHIRRLIEMGYDEPGVARILRKVGLPQEPRSDRGAPTFNLLTVGSLAESVGVSPRTIKHWEDKGIIDADARSEGGFRLYQEGYVYLCNLIQDLQLFGYSLDEIKEVSDYFREFVAMRDDPASFTPADSEARLASMLGAIDRLFDTMGKLQDGIDRWEKLLNKHRKLIVDLKRSNDKRASRSTK